jgi:Tol biopolymer transport system component
VRVSEDSNGVEGNGASSFASISNDGDDVAFYSLATNLVPGDTNGVADIFVADIDAGTIERVSVATGGAQANGASYQGSPISANGRYVAFASDATNLVVGDTNGARDIFVRDRVMGTTERVSVDSIGTQGNGASYEPAIDNTGRYVVFSSDATNLVLNDTNGVRDVFIHDRVTGATERVSVHTNGLQGNNTSFAPSISGDGRFVGFSSDASNLVALDFNGMRDAFVRDRQTGVTTRVSVDSLGNEGNNASSLTAISSDGRYIGLVSDATNLVSNDTNGVTDVFVYDRLTGHTERISEDSSGVEGNGLSSRPGLSSDGRYVVFQSAASNLVAGDTNGATDVFLRDRGLLEALVASGTGDQQNQSAAWNPVNQESLVIWHDASVDDIRGALFDKYGRRLAADIPIRVDSQREAGPSVAYGGGGYLAVWVNGRATDPTGTDIYGAWIMPNGMVQTQLIVTNKTANQRAPSVTYDPVANRFLVVWIDDEFGLTNRNVWRAVLLPGGGVFSAPAAILTLPSDQRGPYARYDYGNSRYFMVWFDNRNGNFDIFGSRMDATGSLLDGTGLLISGASGDQRNPRMAERRPADGINNFVLAWIDFRNGQPDIFGTLVDGDGTVVGSDFQIAGGSGDQRAASVDVDYVRTKKAIVSWIDNTTSGSLTDYDIWRAQVDQTGNVTAPIVEIGTTSDERNPVMLYEGYNGVDNGFLILWRDNRIISNFDIFLKRFFP